MIHLWNIIYIVCLNYEVHIIISLRKEVNIKQKYGVTLFKIKNSTLIILNTKLNKISESYKTFYTLCLHIIFVHYQINVCNYFSKWMFTVSYILSTMFVRLHLCICLLILNRLIANNSC